MTPDPSAVGRFDELDVVVDLPATPAEVWPLLTTAAGLRRWWWDHWDDVEIETDAREGGRYRMAAPAVGIAVEGEYTVVEAPGALEFTWVWIDADGTTDGEAVSLLIEAIEGGTRLAVHHTGPWADAGPADDYREGWGFTLGALAKELARGDDAGRP